MKNLKIFVALIMVLMISSFTLNNSDKGYKVGDLATDFSLKNVDGSMVSLADYKEAGAFASPKSIIMATYMLCGFANFASIGIQIGGIGSLAPGKRVQLSRLGMRALLAGTLASLLSATIVGMIIG